jgi:hypothetical protein
VAGTPADRRPRLPAAHPVPDDEAGIESRQGSGGLAPAARGYLWTEITAWAETGGLVLLTLIILMLVLGLPMGFLQRSCRALLDLFTPGF